MLFVVCLSLFDVALRGEWSDKEGRVLRLFGPDGIYFHQCMD